MLQLSELNLSPGRQTKACSFLRAASAGSPGTPLVPLWINHFRFVKITGSPHHTGGGRGGGKC